jgi:hypothetical protein
LDFPCAVRACARPLLKRTGWMHGARNMAGDFISIETKADIQKLIDQEFEENLRLEYKASPALSRDSSASDELCKDVSAFANSAGGQIIYGVEEDRKTRRPTAIDCGVIDPKISREWIMQILNSRVTPRMEGVTVTRIGLSDGGYGYVINIPQTISGPHQAPDKKYYKRFDGHSEPMLDYEVRDVMNRGRVPQLYINPSFRTGREYTLEFKPHQERSEAVSWHMRIGNNSGEPAEYVRVLLGLDNDLVVVTQVGYGNNGVRTIDGKQYKTFSAGWSVVQTGYPIFKEAEIPMSEQMMIGVHSQHINSTVFYVFVSIQAPGFSKIDHYELRCQGGVLKLVGPLPNR